MKWNFKKNQLNWVPVGAAPALRLTRSERVCQGERHPPDGLRHGQLGPARAGHQRHCQAGWTFNTLETSRNFKLEFQKMYRMSKYDCTQEME